MITYKTGDIFQSNAQVITNTVNCVGVMGKGLALAFKKKYPEMFEDYKQRCDRGEVKPGIPYLWENDQVQVLNFPTKRHWRQDSILSDVEDGLKYLAKNHDEMGISSLALPPLGCGLGGLHWPDVRALIDKHLGNIQILDVYVYEKEEAKFEDKTDAEKSERRSSTKDDGLVAQPTFL